MLTGRISEVLQIVRGCHGYGVGSLAFMQDDEGACAARGTRPSSAEIEARIEQLLAVGVGENPREALAELAKRAGSAMESVRKLGRTIRDRDTMVGVARGSVER
jgi:hypothetical protein